MSVPLLPECCGFRWVSPIEAVKGVAHGGRGLLIWQATAGSSGQGPVTLSQTVVTLMGKQALVTVSSLRGTSQIQNIFILLSFGGLWRNGVSICGVVAFPPVIVLFRSQAVGPSQWSIFPALPACRNSLTQQPAVVWHGVVWAIWSLRCSVPPPLLLQYTLIRWFCLCIWRSAFHIPPFISRREKKPKHSLSKLQQRKYNYSSPSRNTSRPCPVPADCAACKLNGKTQRPNKVHPINRRSPRRHLHSILSSS